MTNEHNHGVVHFEITANDAEKLSQFYTELFGWQIQKVDMGNMPYYVVSTVPSGEDGMPSVAGAINGGIAPRMMPEQRVTNYVSVEDVATYTAKAKGLGAQVAVDKMAIPGMGYFAVFIDPEGNPCGVWQNDSSAS